MSKDFEGQFDEFAKVHADTFLPAVGMESGAEVRVFWRGGEGREVKGF